MAKQYKASVVVDPYNHYYAKMGDYRGVPTDGTRKVAFMSGHDTYAEAVEAAKQYVIAARLEDDAEQELRDAGWTKVSSREA